MDIDDPARGLSQEYSLFEQGHFMSTLLIRYGETQPQPTRGYKPTPRHAINLLDWLIECEKRRPGQYSLIMEMRLGLSSSKLE